MFAVLRDVFLGVPGLFSPPQVVALEQSIPGLEPVFTLDPCRVRIDPCPSFSGRPAAQVLVRPDVVIEEAEFHKRSVEPRERFDEELIQFPFQCSEEALHSAVLPGAVEVDPLMADAKQPKSEAKHFGGEDRFIVRPHCSWLAVALDSFHQLEDQRPA